MDLVQRLDFEVDPSRDEDAREHDHLFQCAPRHTIKIIIIQNKSWIRVGHI
jgi:hypothetical protein